MNKVCVITGGGSGMGLETAKIMAQQGFEILLAGRTAKKLENAVNEIKALGGKAEACSCDVSNYEEVKALAAHAAECGKVMAVIHAAGMSPHMGDAKTIMECNALGTINVNNAFYEVMAEKGCLIDTSSMSAYMLPKMIIPTKTYRLCRVNTKKFMQKIMRLVNLLPKKSRAGFAYAISKNFVIWYARTDAARFGEKGVRVLSVTPGNFETPMGNLEKMDGGTFLKYNAIKRFGRPEEIAQLFAFLIDERLGYLTGADIVCDGGCTASEENKLVGK